MTALLNLITDVPGLSIGNAHDEALASGVTVALFEQPTVASLVVVGGAPATRDTDCLEPEAMVQGIDALVLSGGSGYGLDAASGVQALLRERGRGLAVGQVTVPIVPQAILFDLLNGGDKQWGRYPPYRGLAYEAALAATDRFDLGTAGAGYGATTVNLKGGLGSASTMTPSGFVVGALAAVNSVASATIGDSPHFWAAAFEEDKEFGGLGSPPHISKTMRTYAWKGGPQTATTIAIVATDAQLTKAQAKRLGQAAQGGLAKALRIAHGYTDGDTVFAVSTGRKILTDVSNQMTELGAAASDCLARAVARGVYEATALPFPGALPDWRSKFGRT